MLLAADDLALKSWSARRRKLPMALREPIHHGAKTLGESAVCFATALVALAGIAVALKWILSFLP
jgi:hypothetical protein